jgi:hypothetical protein
VQYPQKNQAKKVMKFRVLKVESAYSTMSGKSKFSWLIYDFSNNVNSETILKHFSCFRLLLRKTRLSHLSLFYSNKFGFASNIWACLSANIALHN